MMMLIISARFVFLIMVFFINNGIIYFMGIKNTSRIIITKRVGGNSEDSSVSFLKQIFNKMSFPNNFQKADINYTEKKFLSIYNKLYKLLESSDRTKEFSHLRSFPPLIKVHLDSKINNNDDSRTVYIVIGSDINKEPSSINVEITDSTIDEKDKRHLHRVSFTLDDSKGKIPANLRIVGGDKNILDSLISNLETIVSNNIYNIDILGYEGDYKDSKNSLYIDSSDNLYLSHSLNNFGNASEDKTFVEINFDESSDYSIYMMDFFDDFNDDEDYSEDRNRLSEEINVYSNIWNARKRTFRFTKEQCEHILSAGYNYNIADLRIKTKMSDEDYYQKWVNLDKKDFIFDLDSYTEKDLARLLGGLILKHFKRTIPNKSFNNYTDMPDYDKHVSAKIIGD